MGSKKSDVKFKYVNTIPNTVNSGTFYWKYENNVNQIYFSPTENKDDILRLDNIISGQGGDISISSNGIVLVGIYEEPETTITNNETGTVSSWSDDDWESYINEMTATEKYGNMSMTYFSRGNVIICGNREFICKEAKPSFDIRNVDGKRYYYSKSGEDYCRDKNGDMIEVSEDNIPEDVGVISYETIDWECFGENISKELAEKIANFNMKIYGSATINVDENPSGSGKYTLSVIIQKDNPLTIIEKEGRDVVVLRDDLGVDGDHIVMSANQIKDVINDIIPVWKDMI